MIHQISPTAIAVEVPEGAKDFECPIQDAGVGVVQYFSNNRWNSEILPPGSYTTVGRASELNEEQAAIVVEFVNAVVRGYKDYKSSFKLFHTALESLHSFCRSINKRPEEVLIINKK